MEGKDQHETLTNFYHEIANLSPLLKMSAALILGAVSEEKGSIDIPKVDYHTQIISELIEIMDAHISYVTLDMNPEFYKNQQPIPLNIHGTIYRITQLFKGKAKSKHVKIGMNKEVDIPNLTTLPIAKVLPYIILDNAVKYSPSHSQVTITFIKGVDSMNIEFESIGPKLSENDVEKIFERGYRGAIAENTNELGRGLGLYYLSKICKICNIDYNVKINPDKSYLFENVEYSEFCIVLTI